MEDFSPVRLGDIIVVRVCVAQTAIRLFQHRIYGNNRLWKRSSSVKATLKSYG